MFKHFFGFGKKQIQNTLRSYMDKQAVDYRLTLTDLAEPGNRTLIEQFCISKCKVVNVLNDSSIATVLGKYMMWVDLRDQGLSPHLLLQGYWELWITSALARLTKPGTLAIDIGANVGYYTMLLAEAVGSDGSVIAFEPNPRLAGLLRSSININGFGSRVLVREEAVSDSTTGMLTLAVPRSSPQNAAIIYSDDQKQGFKNTHGDYGQFVQVKPITLDSLDLKNVGMVKIDAEGAEHSIWRGMQTTIENNPEIQICLEFNTDRSYEWLPFFHEMQSRFKQVRHVDFDGQIKPLTEEMIKTERTKGDWMIYLAFA